MRPVTGSILQRVARCPASASLPGVFELGGAAADRGTAIHQYLQNVVAVGRTAALAVAPSEYHDLCASINVDWIGGMAEQAYYYNLFQDTSVCLGQLGRDYQDAAPGVFPITIDLVTGKRKVTDYKTGRNRVAPVTDNWQMRLSALAVSRAYGCEEVEMSIAYLDEDGEWSFDDCKADAMDLDAWAAELKTIYKRATDAEAIIAKGATVDVYPSPDACQYCPCVASCPAHTALARQLPPTLADIDSRISAMTPAQLGESWEVLQKAEAILERVRKGITEIAKQHPVELPSGKLLKSVEQSRESIDADIAAKVIEAKYGKHVAEVCMEKSTSKAAIKRVCDGNSEEIIDAIRAANGIHSKTYSVMKEVKR